MEEKTHENCGEVFNDVINKNSLKTRIGDMNDEALRRLNFYYGTSDVSSRYMVTRLSGMSDAFELVLELINNWDTEEEDLSKDELWIPM